MSTLSPPLLSNRLQERDALCSFPCNTLDDEWLSDSEDDNTFISPQTPQLLNVEILTHTVTTPQRSSAPDDQFDCTTPLRNIRPWEFLLVFAASPNGQACCATPPPLVHTRRTLPANSSTRFALKPDCTLASSSDTYTPKHRPLLSVSSCSPDFFASRAQEATAAVSSNLTTIDTSQPHSPMPSQVSPLPTSSKSSLPPATSQPSTSAATSYSHPLSPSQSFIPHISESLENTSPTPPTSSATSFTAPADSDLSHSADFSDSTKPHKHPRTSSTATSAPSPDPRQSRMYYIRNDPHASSTATSPPCTDLVCLDASSRVLMSAPEAVLKEVVKIPLATSADKFLYSVCPSSPDVLPMHCLGSGSFGEVKLVYVESPPPSRELRMCAVKTIRLVPSYGLEEFEREVELMGSCRGCPHVLHLFSAGTDQGGGVMMMEVAGHGCLKDLLWAASEYDEQGVPVKGFTEDVARFLMAGLLQALDHLHERGIVHLDVKPENMLLDSKLHPKLCDFGVAQRLAPGQLLQDVAGTPGYQPPEMLAGHGYGTPADIWAAGIAAYQLVVGDIPEDWRLELLLERGIFRSPDCISQSQELEDLLLGLLSVDPSKRLTASQALSHPWFHSMDMAAFQAGLLPCPTITLYHTPTQPISE